MLAIESPLPLFVGRDGLPLDAGYIYFGTVDLNPITSPVTVYWDAAGTQPVSQPVRTSRGLIVRSGTPAKVYASGNFSMLVKDSTGAQVVYERNSSEWQVSAYVDELRSDLASTSDASKGAGMEGFNWALNYAANTVGWATRASTGHTNILRYIPPSEWAAIFAGASTYDILSIFNTAKANNDSLFFPAAAHFYTSGPLVMDKEGFKIVGGSRSTTIIDQFPGFTGVATVHVTGGNRLQDIECMHVRGGIANGSDAIRVTDGPMCSIKDVMVKVGVAGVRLIAGNAQRWTNVYAESNTNGFMVVPSAADDTNGCTMIGLRAYGNTSYGLDIQAGAGPNGHMHSAWDISTENNGLGVRIRGGRYCQYSLYSESNTGAEFDLDPNAAHFYFLKNPDGASNGALFSDVSYSAGYDGIGGNIQLDAGITRQRVTVQAFSASASLAGVGVGIYYVTNTSGGTRNMTLSFLSYAPVGFCCEIIKTDNTAGLTPVAPGGITLTGVTGTFGAFVSAGSAAVLRVRKIDASTATLY